MNDYEKKKREARHIKNIESIMMDSLRKTHKLIRQSLITDPDEETQ